MSVPFPSVEFFEALKQGIAADPQSMAAVEPSDAYCGFAIGDNLFVVEFDGHRCAAVANGGNTLDLDFFLSAPSDVWLGAIEKLQQSGNGAWSLLALVDGGQIELCSESDKGEELGRAALKFLEAFLGQARNFDVQAA